MEKRFTVLLLFMSICSAVYGQHSYGSLEELFQQARSGNYTLKNAVLQKDLAAITRKIAGINAFSPRVPVSYQAIDNIALQKMYVPGQLFGQPEGTYKELIMGQKYVATFSLQPQFDVLNFGNRAQRKSAVLNEQAVQLTERQQERDIFLQINSAYYNVLSFYAQKKVLNENREVALKILELIRNRQSEGLARVQEVNEAEVNVLTINDKIFQLDQNVILQLEMIRLLINTDDLPVLSETLNILEHDVVLTPSVSDLDREVAALQSRIAEQDVHTARRDQWPVLSVISSFNWQNLNNSFFYGPGSNGIYYAFAGLKLSWDLPTNVQKISNLKNQEVQLKIAQNMHLQAENQQRLNDSQRETELHKARGQWQSLKRIEALRRDTFEKNYAQFEEEILALDKLLISQNDWLMSQLNLATGTATVKYNQEIIRINNQY